MIQKIASFLLGGRAITDQYVDYGSEYHLFATFLFNENNYYTWDLWVLCYPASLVETVIPVRLS
jgi:hypothetical protein